MKTIYDYLESKKHCGSFLNEANSKKASGIVKNLKTACVEFINACEEGEVEDGDHPSVKEISNALVERSKYAMELLSSISEMLSYASSELSILYDEDVRDLLANDGDVNYHMEIDAGNLFVQDPFVGDPDTDWEDEGIGAIVHELENVSSDVEDFISDNKRAASDVDCYIVDL